MIREGLIVRHVKPFQVGAEISLVSEISVVV